jgi:ABC-type Mn2+/Zn2+ transport system ATPase subunit
MTFPRLPYGGRARPRKLGAGSSNTSIDNQPAVEVIHVSVEYPGSGRPALQHVDLTVNPGERVALIGPNGSGKSTLLKAIAGVLPISSGEIRVAGAPVGADRHRVAYLAQRGELDWQFPISVRQLALTGRYVHLGWLRRPAAADHRIVDEMLRKLRIDDLAERSLAELSGGQQQRAMLARALAQQADILLLDEPMNAVDVETRTIVTDLQRELRRAGKTFVVATHDLDHVEQDFDRIVFLQDGRQVDGPAEGHHHHH